MKILVLGATGMAGHVVSTYFSEAGHQVDTLAATRQLNPNTITLDVTHSDQFLAKLNQSTYDVIINCIGVLVRESDEKKSKAVYLNSYLPKLLEENYKDTSTRLIHISSDGVFSGARDTYFEDSPCDSRTFYGQTKALGEIINDKDLTIRTSIVGPELRKDGSSLFNWFFNQKVEVNGFTESFWRGLTTLELAKVIEQALDQNTVGLYHIVPRDRISKFDLLSLIKKSFYRNMPVVKPSSGTTTNANILSKREDLNYSVQTYEKMTDELYSWVIAHKDLYPHYNL